jgi:DNA-binding CsgD family transcriptional regulator
VSRRKAAAANAGTLAPERFSDLIGAIYDCAVNPALWPQTIVAIAEAANCFAGMIGIVDLQNVTAHALFPAGYPAGCVECMMSYAPEMIGMFRSVPDLTALYDEPVSARRTVLPDVLEASPYAQEMMTKYGISDSINLILLAQPTRIAEFGLSRHESCSGTTDGDLAVVRLLAPHIRRSVTISDLLDMKSIETQALGAALDSFAIGVVIVGGEGRILHSNEPARGMLAKGSPIVSNGGRLATLQAKTTGELLEAIAIAQTNEAAISKLGIGIPLIDSTMKAATAHVLPLARGEQRGRLMRRAAAAIFVMPADTPQPVDLAVVARMFSLTPAEGRVLSHLAASANIPEVAAMLGISEATAKTHRTRLFAKMGVSRRAELLVMLAQLIPPLRR